MESVEQIRIKKTALEPAPATAADYAAFTAEVVDIFASVALLLGFPRSYGQIYGVLYGSPKSLTFAEIQAQSGMSKGSVSQGLKALREFGAVLPDEKSGFGRWECYKPEIELRYLLGGCLRERLVPKIEEGGRRVSHLKKLAQALPKEEISFLLLQRAKKLEKWQRRASKLLPLLAKLIGK